jgi:LysR family transcriptional activator of nhaA
VLLPGAESPVRRFLDAWLAGNGIAPRIVGEFDDAGQREVFGVAGHGLFFAPDLIADDLERQYGVVKIGRLPDVWVRYFLVTPVRAFTPPAEIAIRSKPTAIRSGRAPGRPRKKRSPGEVADT